MMMMIIIIIIIKTTRTATIAIIIKQWRIWKRVSSIRDSIDLQQFNAVVVSDTFGNFSVAAE